MVTWTDLLDKYALKAYAHSRKQKESKSLTSPPKSIAYALNDPGP